MRQLLRTALFMPTTYGPLPAAHRIGSAMHPPPRGGTTGHPRFVCEKHGGKFVAEDGKISRNWPWEAPIGASWSPDIPDEWSFNLNKCLHFRASSRQDMTLTFKSDSITMEFDVGEVLRRADDLVEVRSAERDLGADADNCRVRHS